MNIFVPKTGLSIERLCALCRVAEHGGIAAAAPGNPTEQSKISSQLRDLSDCFGVKLTRRDGRGIALTDAGKELAKICREHFLALHDFDNRCRNESSAIVIGAGDSLLQWAVLPRLAKIQAAIAPSQIEVSNLRTSEIVEGLRRLTLDFGLIRRVAVPEPFQKHSVKIGDYSYAIWIPKAFVSGQKNPSLESEARKLLAKVPFAMIKTHWGTVFDDLAPGAAQVQFHVCVRCDSFTQISQAMATGKYAAVMPRFATPFIDVTKFVEFTPKFVSTLNHEICLVWNPRFTHVKACGEKAIKVFAENLKFTHR